MNNLIDRSAALALQRCIFDENGCSLQVVLVEDLKKLPAASLNVVTTYSPYNLDGLWALDPEEHLAQRQETNKTRQLLKPIRLLEELAPHLLGPDPIDEKVQQIREAERDPRVRWPEV